MSRLDRLREKFRRNPAKYRTQYILAKRKAIRTGELKGEAIHEENQFQRAVLISREQEGVLKLEKAAAEGKVNIDKKIIEQTKKNLFDRAYKNEKESVTQVKDQLGRTYSGKEVGSKFIGVRTVSKREQQLKDQPFYSVFDTWKPELSKGQIIAQQTKTRASIGIYTKLPLTQDVKFKFETPKAQPEPKPNIFQEVFSINKEKVKDVKYKLKLTEYKVKNVYPTKFIFREIKGDTKFTATFKQNAALFLASSKHLSKKIYKNFPDVVKVSDFSHDTMAYSFTAFEKTVRTPSTYVLAGGFKALTLVKPTQLLFSTTTVRTGLVTAYGVGTGVKVGISPNKPKALGESIGTFAGYTVAFGVVDVAYKTPKFVYTKAKAGYQHLRAEYLFKFKQPNIYSNLDYSTGGRYFTGYGQKNLYGRTLGKTPKIDANKNIIFERKVKLPDGTYKTFRIEKNTLKGSGNNLLSSGQTKIINPPKPKIVAIDKITGQQFKVKVTPNKEVFVYNPSVKAYTEFSGQTFKLVTLTPKYPLFDSVKTTSIFKPDITFKYDSSIQTKLIKDITVKPTTKPFYVPKVSKSVFITSQIKPRVFSETGVTSVYQQQSNPFVSFGKTTTSTYYSTSVSTTPSTGKAPLFPSAKAEGLYKGFTPMINFNVKDTTGSGLKYTATPSFKLSPKISSRELPKISDAFKVLPSEDVSSLNIQKPKIRQSVKPIQAQKPLLDTIQITVPIQVTTPFSPMQSGYGLGGLGKGGGFPDNPPPPPS